MAKIIIFMSSSNTVCGVEFVGWPILHGSLFFVLFISMLDQLQAVNFLQEVIDNPWHLDTLLSLPIGTVKIANILPGGGHGCACAFKLYPLLKEVKSLQQLDSCQCSRAWVHVSKQCMCSISKVLVVVTSA